MRWRVMEYWELEIVMETLGTTCAKLWTRKDSYWLQYGCAYWALISVRKDASNNEIVAYVLSSETTKHNENGSGKWS